MKNKILSFILCAVILVSLVPATVSAAKNTEDIIILYENDVHCAVEGYSTLAALKKELLETYEHVGVVSSGDYIQGSSLGVVSKGEYIIDLMNLVGYDAVALGNHEFDYHLSRLDELVDMMNTKPVCCNFEKVSDGAPYFDPYTLVEYGEVSVAYVGVTTPSTISTSSPAQFKDEAGNYVYTFHQSDLYETVQETVDAAIADGADYVIALSHIGDKEPSYDVKEMIESTTGLSAVLDAHSHSIIEGETVKDASGKDVLLTSTGTKFEHIGKLTISDGSVTSELIKTEEYTAVDPEVDALLKAINDEYSILGDRKVGKSEVDLITHDADGNRLVRVTETNLGDFASDAFRKVLGADIGFVQGGGIRAPISKGDITFNDLLNVLPFNNTGVVVEISGQAVKDMLELAMMSWPEENGTFPQISGVVFSFNTSIPSSVTLNENEEFAGVDGAYRVYNIKVQNSETGAYEPLDLEKSYTVASTNYMILEYGNGMVMFKNAKVVRNDGILDVEILEQYLTEHLDGVIGQEYAAVKPNIYPTEGELAGDKELPAILGDHRDAIIIVAIHVVAVIGFAVFVIIRKKKQREQEQNSTRN